MESLNLPDNVNDTEDQTVLAPHRQVAAVSIARNRVLLSRDAEQFVHFAKGADQVRVCVSREQD